MGLLVQLAELLGRLSLLTPLLERYLRSNRSENPAIAPLQESIAELSTAHADLGSSLRDALKEQHLRLARLEDSVARMTNRLAELSTDREKLDTGLAQVKKLLKISLAVGLSILVVSLIAVALILVR